MAELRRLKLDRKNIKDQVVRLDEFLTTFGDENIEKLKIRAEKVALVWEKFENIQVKIELLEKEDELDVRERIAFENLFFDVMAKANKIIAQNNEQTATVAQVSGIEQLQSSNSVKLPTLSLPSFSGNYEEWLLFKDSFISAIESHSGLSDIQKFQYLRGTLKGEALQVIHSIKTSAENYKIAWGLLLKRYENKRLIVNSHIQAVVEMTSVKENHVTLRKFVDSIQMHLSALEALSISVNAWDTLLIYLLMDKLDFQTRKEWEEFTTRRKIELPEMQEFLEFLLEKCQTLEMIEKKKIKPENSKVELGKRMVRNVALHSRASHVCEICKEEHMLIYCEKFKGFPVEKRLAEARQLKLCLNCLKTGHYGYQCQSSRCQQCKGRHHTLLHLGGQNTSETTVTTYASQKQSYLVLLSTARVYLEDSEGNMHEGCALLDSGSQSNFLTSEMCQRLKLPIKTINKPVIGISKTITNVSKQTKVRIRSRFSSFGLDLECLVLETITDRLPSMKLDSKPLNIPTNLTMADPFFNIPKRIDLLIGASHFFNLLCAGQIQLARNQPLLQKTQLGWVVTGHWTLHSSDKQICLVGRNMSLEDQVERFWKTEEIGNLKRQYSDEERRCEEHFVQNVTRNEDGRFVVSLPTKSKEELGDSFDEALRRLFSLERIEESKQ